MNLPRPPAFRGRDALARWMAVVSFTAGMSCLIGHRVGIL